MSRRTTILLAAGCLAAGMGLAGPAAQAAETVLEAIPSPQSFQLDGEPVALEAYSIQGYNYVPLTQLAQLLGAEVTYCPEDNSVRIETGAAEQSAPLTVNPPADDARYIPQAGDVIRCDDGTNYIITDVSRYGLDPFYPDGRLPDELPEPTCDWSRFSSPALPNVEARRFQTAGGDMLFLRNLYETRRMQGTLYNLLGAAGSGGDVAGLSIDWELGVGEFWPCRDSELEKVVAGRPGGTYYVEAWDCFKDGVFQHTRYRLDVK